MNTAVIAVAFVLLGAALLVSDWRTKVVLAVLIPAFGFAIWPLSRPLTGWPTDAAPPKSAQFISGVAREPVEIDIWAVPDGADQPRAYKLPYTKQLHQQLERAMKATKAGQAVGVRQPNGKRHGHGQKSRHVFYKLPPPMPPRKESN